tara:strand:+ start:2758 stop:4059 length:1302 start_codon:yes stop_codon:yes gene_type:complete
VKYYSLNKNSNSVSFKEALTRGIAPDKGLYFPNIITPFKTKFIQNLKDISNNEIAYECLRQFTEPDISNNDLINIIEETINFDFPLIKLNKKISVLELFHGPTMAFKDVGARFLSRCTNYFINKQKSSKKITVLVATSGDTGAAVANSFYDLDGINVIILYPSKKVSNIQEKQLTTLSKNITALEINGTFDDCQSMVKHAFLDNDINNKLNLTSANSINVGRWLPQMLYYFISYKKLNNTYKNLAFSVPSGNFGNICAGMIAQKLGLPIQKFISANNSNDTVNIYLKTKNYNPKPSVQTISNAMDVGDPSNFIRIKKIYNNNYKFLKKNLIGYSYSDNQTRKAILELYKKHNYISDPHGAVAFLGTKDFLKTYNDYHCVFLETAHPSKFLNVVENILDLKIELPEQISSIINKKKRSIKITSYNEFKDFLLKN